MTALHKLTLKEMGETAMITRQVDMWGMGGDMRGISGDDPMPPGSPLERAAIIAFDVAMQSEENGGRPIAGERVSGRDRLLELTSVALRLAIVDEREGGSDGRTDVDRARQVLVSMAMVLAMRDRADGLEPSMLENAMLDGMRRKSGLEASAFSLEDAHAVAVGMGDMVKGEEAVRQVASAMRGSLTPSIYAGVEDRLEMADATWPQAVARTQVPNAVPARSPDSSMPAAALQREASDRAARAAGR
jgi:hypothetical protein